MCPRKTPFESPIWRVVFPHLGLLCLWSRWPPPPLQCPQYDAQSRSGTDPGDRRASLRTPSARALYAARGPRLAPGRTPGRCAPPLPCICTHARIRLYIKETSPSCTARCAQCDRHTRSSVDTASSSQLGNAKCVCAVPRSRRRLHSLPRAAATKLI